jgi:hypothetical protein
VGNHLAAMIGQAKQPAGFLPRIQVQSQPAFFKLFHQKPNIAKLHTWIEGMACLAKFRRRHRFLKHLSEGGPLATAPEPLQVGFDWIHPRVVPPELLNLSLNGFGGREEVRRNIVRMEWPQAF